MASQSNETFYLRCIWVCTEIVQGLLSNSGSSATVLFYACFHGDDLAWIPFWNYVSPVTLIVQRFCIFSIKMAKIVFAFFHLLEKILEQLTIVTLWDVKKCFTNCLNHTRKAYSRDVKLAVYFSLYVQGKYEDSTHTEPRHVSGPQSSTSYELSIGRTVCLLGTIRFVIKSFSITVALMVTAEIRNLMLDLKMDKQIQKGVERGGKICSNTHHDVYICGQPAVRSLHQSI